MVGASWRLACTMLCEVGAKMGPRSKKIASVGDLGAQDRKKSPQTAILGPSSRQVGSNIFFLVAPGGSRIGLNLQRLSSAGGGGVAPGRVRVGKSLPGLDFRI